MHTVQQQTLVVPNSKIVHHIGHARYCTRTNLCDIRSEIVDCEHHTVVPNCISDTVASRKHRTESDAKETFCVDIRCR